MRRGWYLLIIGLLLTTPGCTRRRVSDVEPERVPVRVEVKNKYTLPMEVYAAGSGITYRLGLVHPGMSSRFTLPQALIGGSAVEFQARPSAAGGGQGFRSGGLLLAPGSIVDFVIEAQLFASTVTLRP